MRSFAASHFLLFFVRSGLLGRGALHSQHQGHEGLAHNQVSYQPVFRILVWIRIRILLSVPLTNGSGSGSCYVPYWPSKRQQKANFNNVFLLIFLKVHYHHFSIIKSPKEVTKQCSRFFLLFLLDDRRIRIREAQKHVDPVDPDPEHWYQP